ncbi:MAG: hypothetical protein E6Q33_00065 [Neisseriales bacterium]|nr:MAG: hypothetical protein E6Q33_00065 [Neisseriales bacterium]
MKAKLGLILLLSTGLVLAVPANSADNSEGSPKVIMVKPSGSQKTEKQQSMAASNHSNKAKTTKHKSKKSSHKHKTSSKKAKSTSKKTAKKHKS